ncbi:MAG: hypothetical protein HC914_13440, partial [Chloroflexaceae bacterium]|nr:hypothetical protein [Chloroflexaceae bacterium]
SPDGEQILSGDDAATIWLWDRENGTALRQFEAEGAITGLAFCQRQSN